jgi:hypothetical protein
MKGPRKSPNVNLAVRTKIEECACRIAIGNHAAAILAGDVVLEKSGSLRLALVGIPMSVIGPCGCALRTDAKQLIRSVASGESFEYVVNVDGRHLSVCTAKNQEPYEVTISGVVGDPSHRPFPARLLTSKLQQLVAEGNSARGVLITMTDNAIEESFNFERRKRTANIDNGSYSVDDIDSETIRNVILAGGTIKGTSRKGVGVNFIDKWCDPEWDGRPSVDFMVRLKSKAKDAAAALLCSQSEDSPHGMHFRDFVAGIRQDYDRKHPGHADRQPRYDISHTDLDLEEIVSLYNIAVKRKDGMGLDEAREILRPTDQFAVNVGPGEIEFHDGRASLLCLEK